MIDARVPAHRSTRRSRAGRDGRAMDQQIVHPRLSPGPRCRKTGGLCRGRRGTALVRPVARCAEGLCKSHRFEVAAALAEDAGLCGRGRSAEQPSVQFVFGESVGEDLDTVLKLEELAQPPGLRLPQQLRGLRRQVPAMPGGGDMPWRRVDAPGLGLVVRRVGLGRALCLRARGNQHGSLTRSSGHIGWGDHAAVAAVS